MSIRLVLQGMSRLQLQPFVRAASHLSESQKAVHRLASVALEKLKHGHLSITSSDNAIWTRIGDLKCNSKITLSRRPKEEIGASFLKISVEEPDEAIFAETFAGICHAIKDSKGTDYITVDIRKLSEDQKKFLERFLDCKKYNVNEFLIPESTRNTIEAIWAKSSDSKNPLDLSK